MCRNIKTLYNFEPPVTEDEIRASAIQIVRKLSGFTHPSKANEVAFERAVCDVAEAASRRVKSIEKYNKRRNDVVHALWTVEAETRKLAPLQPKSTLRGKDLKKAMNELSAELTDVAVDLFILHSKISNHPIFAEQIRKRREEHLSG